jgi:alpha-tubulin suppressor-like RCC1 family protein
MLALILSNTYPFFEKDNSLRMKAPSKKMMLSRQSFAIIFGLTLALIFTGLFCISSALAMPRGPLPPVPEAPALYHESFDEEYYPGETNIQLVVSGWWLFNESWSGYALERSGDSVTPFIVPAQTPDGYTNISADMGGALRWWVNPLWSSQSQTNGTGPGATATLLEFDAVSGGDAALIWSLQISADGDTVELVTPTGTVLAFAISWQAGHSHCLVLDYSTDGTTLYLDGTLLLQGSGLASIPTSVGQLVIGSTLSGTNTAAADFEEFYSFNRILSDSDVANYYSMTGSTAALGPISYEEQGQWSDRHSNGQMESIRSPGNVFDPEGDGGGCPTGGPVYLTNILATLQTNGTTSVTFDIQGGTNGIFYDIFTTLDLQNSVTNYQWNWIGQGLTCTTYTFTNQSPAQAFYQLEVPTETLTIAFDGDNEFGQLETPYGLSNSIAVAAGGYFSLALLNTGTVIGWGDNAYGETNIPPGLSNVVALAAGLYHGVALLANGSVTNWGQYWDGTSYYTSVTNRAYSSAPPTSNVVAVAAGMGQDLALLSNGAVVAWGFTNVNGTGAAFGTQVPSSLNLTNVSAIACGWQFNIALSSNGAVTAWGYNDPLFGYPINLPADLASNVVAIAAGAGNGIALRNNGTVEAWGYPGSGVTNVPTGLSNVVAVATGGEGAMALQAAGEVVAWGDDSLTNIPTGMVGVKAISAGFDHNLVIESGLLAPVIFTQSTDQYAVVGGTVTFSVEGAGVAGLQYQWQFNGVNLTGATNVSLTLTNTQAANEGNYQVVISTDAGTITSSAAAFTLVLPPQIVAVSPPALGLTWANYGPVLNVTVTAAGQLEYPVTYGWQFNGTNIPGASSASLGLYNLTSQEGTYSVGITNAAGSTNLSFGPFFIALPGMVEAWGSDDSGECNRPASLTNATGIAAGEYQSVAVTDTGSVVQWGEYWDGADFYSVTNTSYVTLPPTSNVVTVAAGLTQALALMNDGTVRAWGLSGAYGTEVPSGLTGVKAIACGWQFNAALLTNGTVTAWGEDDFGQTNVPAGLTNVTAIATGAQHTLALLANGTVQAWGDGFDGDTNVPAGLSNVVAVAAGESHNLALLTNGTVVAWGLNDYGQTNVPAGLSNVMAIAAGDNHSVALRNDSTLVEWGDNSSGQTNIPDELPTSAVFSSGGLTPSFDTNFYPPIVVKLIAAGGNHTVAAIFSPLVQYPIDVSQDLLLIYNSTNISLSSNVCAYYKANRPLVSNANVLGISCATDDLIQMSDYTNTFAGSIMNWLLANPTKRPQYVILFQDLPSRLQNGEENTSVQYDISSGYDPYLQTTNYFSYWKPFVTSINMNGTNGASDCTNYINKLISFASNYCPNQLIISASVGGYGNANWYFDGGLTPDSYGLYAGRAVSYFETSSSLIETSGTNITSDATNVAAYFTCGWDCLNDTDMFVDGTVRFFGQSAWYVMTTIDSFDGQRDTDPSDPEFVQANFLSWFTTNSFGGTNYSNTPVGALTTVNEPLLPGKPNPATFYGEWAAGKSFAISAWAANSDWMGVDWIGYGYTPFNGGPQFQAVGDPFVRK